MNWSKPFVKGMAVTLDLFGTSYEGPVLKIHRDTSPGYVRDILALQRDWEMVGKDLRSSMKSYTEESR